MQAKRVWCVLPREFSLIDIHGFLTSLPRPQPDSQLPRLVNAASASWNCITHITADPACHSALPRPTLLSHTTPSRINLPTSHDADDCPRGPVLSRLRSA